MVEREPKPKNNLHLFRRVDQTAINLKRAKFYEGLHKKVSGGLLSIEAANGQVKQYNHSQQILIPGTPWTINRFW